MAKRFRFRLEHLLTLRTRKEEAQKREVARAAADLREAQILLEEVNREQDALVQEGRRIRGSSRLDIDAARSEQARLLHLNRRREQINFDIQQLDASLQEERAKLIERRTEKKVVEKLRERHWDQHKELEQREQRIEEDEIALQICCGQSALTDQVD